MRLPLWISTSAFSVDAVGSKFVNENSALRSSNAIGKNRYQLKLKVAVPVSRCMTRSGSGEPGAKPSCSQWAGATVRWLRNRHAVNDCSR